MLNVTMDRHYTEFTFSEETSVLDLTREMQAGRFVKMPYQEKYTLYFRISPSEYTEMWQDLLARVRINFYFYHNNTNKS